MTSRSVSPGGALLRASRVFSIPAPLPRPAVGGNEIFDSDTATLPHPIHLSITTPASSRARGDWGFKRPLPLRSTTKTSTPFIKVSKIDTFEHITEYGSSADHAMSLKKWQEMDVPITLPVKKNTGLYRHEERRSVFDDDIDTTTIDETLTRKDTARWSYKGPWLGGMNDGEFNTWLKREVKNNRSEFKTYLREACAQQLTAQARREAVGQEEAPHIINPSDITEAQLTEYIKNLRWDTGPRNKLIRAFMDLPPPPTNNIQTLVESLISRDTTSEFVVQEPESISPYAGTGPPKTHPSAGIAYGRTSATMFNHPTHGPQAHKPPIPARVVLPRHAGVGAFGPALGVGGFVTVAPIHSELRSTARPPGLQFVEPERVGGSKMWVEAEHAQIDPRGKVVLRVDIADVEAVAVKEGKEAELKAVRTDLFQVKKAGWTSPVAPAGAREAAGAGLGFAQQYGRYGLKRDGA